MIVDEKYISEIVANVVGSMQKKASEPKQKGVFDTMSEALEAVAKAYEEFKGYTVAQREKMISKIRELILEEADVMAQLGVEETGMGRVADKVIKHQLVANKTPGTEDLKPSVITGDDGLTLIEQGAFGVIGSITPSTNPSETVLCNSMGMIAGGNAVVFNPHPHACKTANYAVDLVNRAIQEAGGPENLVVSVKKPTRESSNEMMASPIVRMLVATGGPGVVKALLSSGKKAIGAGAGNPPVIVDDTADVEKAGADIVVMLHPDYQYTPKLIPAIVCMMAFGQYDAVLASRMLGNSALKGGMPFYKFVSNKFLTAFENIFTGEKLTEYHTGFRGFTREVLEKLPLGECDDDFIFDNEMIALMFYNNFKIGEVSCPTKYFKEASSINFLRSCKYGLGVLAVSLKFRLAKMGLKTKIFKPDAKKLDMSTEIEYYFK